MDVSKFVGKQITVKRGYGVFNVDGTLLEFQEESTPTVAVPKKIVTVLRPVVNKHRWKGYELIAAKRVIDEGIRRGDKRAKLITDVTEVLLRLSPPCIVSASSVENLIWKILHCVIKVPEPPPTSKPVDIHGVF